MSDHGKLVLVTPKQLQSALDYFNELREKHPDELHWDSEEEYPDELLWNNEDEHLGKNLHNTIKMLIYNNRECVPWDDVMKVMSVFVAAAGLETHDLNFYDNVVLIIETYGCNREKYDFSECEIAKVPCKKRKISNE